MHYDVITVGGGLAGSTLAATLASAGHRVLVLEQETRFKDRVRGENLLPWGVAAARRLGIVDHLVAAGGHQPPWWTTYMGGDPVNRRDLRTTKPHGEVSLNIYHPDMQEALLQRANAAGAEVKRGAKVVHVDSQAGRDPGVTFDHAGKRHTLTAGVVVGTDGRESQVRRWGGFQTRKDPDLLTIAGVLLGNTAVPDDSVHLAFGAGCASLVAPLCGGRARVYYIYPGHSGRLGLSGDKVRQFLRLCCGAGIPESWLAGAEPLGPLAEFAGADRWIESPAGKGLALAGDAAAASDPSWGSGLALALLDVEHLAQALCRSEDRDAALRQYAKDHDGYYSALHRVHSWMTELMWTPGPEGDSRRQRVFPRMVAEPAGFPDLVGLGPHGPCGEEARKLILGLA